MKDKQEYATKSEFDRLNTEAAQLFPLVLEQRPGKILQYDATTNSVTWIWQSYNVDDTTGYAIRIDHPNGLIGSPTFMPAFPVGNADFSTVVLPVEAWFRKRLSSPTTGPNYEFDANCCPPPGSSGTPGGLGCCDGTTPATITLTLTGSGTECGDCFPVDVDLVFDSDSQRWKGQHTCTFGDCDVTFHFMMQCYDCADPPLTPDCTPDCTGGATYYFCLTHWTETSGDGCPPTTYGTVSWSSDEVTCDPFALNPKDLTNPLPGIDCDVTVHSGSSVLSLCCPDNPLPSALFVTVVGTGVFACMNGTYEMDFDASLNPGVCSIDPLGAWVYEDVGTCGLGLRITFGCSYEVSSLCVPVPVPPCKSFILAWRCNNGIVPGQNVVWDGANASAFSCACDPFSWVVTSTPPNLTGGGCAVANGTDTITFTVTT